MEENKINDPDKTIEDILKGKYAEVERPVSNEIWEVLDKKLEAKNIYKDAHIIKLKRSRWLLWTAAALIPLILAFTGWFFLLNKKEETTVQQNLKEPTIASSKTQKAEGVIPQKDSVTVPFKAKEYSKDKLALTSLHFQTKSEKSDFYLPDSSKVYLNHQSDLTYISGRKVNLKGEAYFEVTHLAKSKFEVSTNNATITVLGTTFLIDNTLENKTIVTVYTGIVVLTSKNQKEKKLLVKAGSTGIVDSNGTLELKNSLDSNLLSWKENRLSFSGTPLLQVAGILEKHFHTRITISNQNLEKCTFTGTFMQPDLTKILKIMGATFDLKYELKDGVYQLSGKGCIK